MTLGELKKYAAQLIDEYSNNSDITSDDDIRLKLNSLFNIAQFELCQLKKINSSISITQDIPQNTISPKINTNELYRHDKNSLVFSGVGKCYYFQIKGNGTVTIAQKGMNDISINNEENNNFKTYKGITTGTGEIKLTFSGASYYEIRNVAIFDVNYNTGAEIPNYERYIEYELPTDYYQLDFVEFKGGEVKDYTIRNKKIKLSSYYVGECIINYFKYPTVINDETEDTFEFELDLEAQMILPYYVASDVLKSDVSANYTSFEAKYNAKLEILNTTNTSNKTIEINQIMGCL